MVQNSDIEDLLLLNWKPSNYSIELTRTLEIFCTKLFILLNFKDKFLKIALHQKYVFQNFDFSLSQIIPILTFAESIRIQPNALGRGIEL